ncbi:metalloregulator ArsR/SmtB family transcription factor [uncultured Pontibacter sp.]|uniref:ArsR/SmtB family transcription factor n=1 Tax=uncultured Pontibacter sp. TaxID=453356 RepID=UPI00261C1A5E|nr:metalloregulator ArsR/SmtB family transcription factor [uncultured Pontibacter sp.]
MEQEKQSPCIRVYANKKQISSFRRKIEDLTDPIQFLSSALSLVGNEARLKILFLLKEEGELCPCDISDILTMTVPSISQHLRKLKEGGLITAKKSGQTIFYTLTPEAQKLLQPHFELLTYATINTTT